MSISAEQKIRAVLYYLSLLVFFAGLPFILTYTLGYRFDHRTFAFTRTGLISVKTEPAGASVYLDGRLMPEKTPCSINELLPGVYHLDLMLDGYYPYANEVRVAPNTVTRMEKVILFALRPDISKLNRERVLEFWIDEARRHIYFVHPDEKAIYRSDTDGEHYEQVSAFLPLAPAPREWLLSPDRTKLAYYNPHQIGLVNLTPDTRTLETEKQYILQYPSDSIRKVFWFSNSFHLIVVGSRQVAMLEARPGALPLVLMTLNKRNAEVVYDPTAEALYFSDTQKSEEGKTYDNIYKLELKTKLYPLKDLLRLKQNDREQKY